MKKQYLFVPVVCVCEQHLLEGQSVKSEEAVQDTCKGEGVLALLLTASLLAFHSFNLEVWGCSEANKPSKNLSVDVAVCHAVLVKNNHLLCRTKPRAPLPVSGGSPKTP